MNKSRVESFSDGVMAIIITVMIFNLKPPAETTRKELLNLVPQLLSYFESFLIIGIFWYKHNKLFASFKGIERPFIWANHLFLFFLSLIPLVTNWATQSSDEVWPRFFYGIVLLTCFLSFFFLQSLLSLGQRKSRTLILLGNSLSIVIALFSPWLAYILFGIIGLIFLFINEEAAPLNDLNHL